MNVFEPSPAKFNEYTKPTTHYIGALYPSYDSNDYDKHGNYIHCLHPDTGCGCDFPEEN